jgi:hypothetical protein
MVLHERADRVLHFKPVDFPVLSVYLAVRAVRREFAGVMPRLQSLLKPVWQLAHSHELGHDRRESLLADVSRGLDIKARAREFQGRAASSPARDLGSMTKSSSAAGYETAR